MTVTRSGVGGSITIREAVRADLLSIYRIECASFPQPWPFTAFEQCIGQPGFLVAADEAGVSSESDQGPIVDGIVGYVVTDVVPNHGRPLGHVKDIAVHPDRRGEGIGSTLLESALSVCSERDVDRVKLEVRVGNEGARSLYREYGFRKHRRIAKYYDDGEDALVMVREGDQSAGL